jgi:DNA-binding winged helix-turn-helix (wHTH) protein/TolB-like protein/Tfp pilus assembly protein PilF
LDVQKIFGKNLESVAPRGLKIGSNGLYRFGEFRVDAKNRLLLRGSETIPITPKAFDLLLLFVENSGTLLRKDELIERLWGRTVVEESNLARNISFLRKALGEHPKHPEYIVTVAGHGYRFVADVQEVLANNGAPFAIDARFPSKVPNRARSRTITFVAVAAVVILPVGIALALLRAKKPAPPTSLPLVKTIAVLPSTPSAPEDRDPAAEFGLAASLIYRLSGVRSLVVRPAAAIVKYTSVEQDPIAAGREQQVNYVLVSSYRKSGEKFVLSAKLINVNDNSVLWSDTCEEQCNTFAWQDALAEKTAQSLLTTLSDDHRQLLTKHGTENQKAYDLFNLGLYGWYKNNYDLEGLKKSAEYFEQAIALDPNYAAAYGWLATTNSRLGLAVGAERKEYERKADELARKALQLDDTVIQAYLVLGVSAYSYHWDWAQAEEHFKRARELNPDDAEVARTYAAYLASTGRLDESVFWQRRACDLQPLSFDVNAILVLRLFIARRYNEAIDQAHKALQMTRATPTLYFVWRSYEQQNMYDEAYRALQELIVAEKDKETGTMVSQAYAASGYEKAREVYLQRRLKNLAKRAQLENFNPLEPAIVCALLGNRDEAFKWLEEAYQDRSFGLIYIKVDPELDSLRSDPRYTDLLRRMNLASSS